MLNEGIKEEFVRRLRSGKYKKCERKLATKSGKRCAIGVLCDVIGVDWEYDREFKRLRPKINGCFIDSVAGVSLSYPILDYIGLTMREHDDISNLNDGMGAIRRHSFKEIADYIDERL